MKQFERMDFSSSRKLVKAANRMAKRGEVQIIITEDGYSMNFRKVRRLAV